MFLPIFLLLLMEIVTCSQVGSALFYKKLTEIDCWSVDELVKLRARKALEDIVPTSVNPDEINDAYVTEILRYIRNAFRTVDSSSNVHTSTMLKEVLADAIGGHMRSEILPAVRFAYYAGYISYRKVRELHDNFDLLKTFLNTRGLGWKKPDHSPEMVNFTVEKIQLGSNNIFDPCARLITKRDSKSCIHLLSPKVDDTLHPHAIVLPFKKDGLFSIRSPNAENILIKYYTRAGQCILQSSPEPCRHADFVSFNDELWHWMKRDVAPHLSDETLYAGFGGVLRIAAAVQSYGKGLHRRNLFEFQDAGVTKWHPWKALKESYIYINKDWTPHLYVATVLLISLAICFLQILYSYIFGNKNGCHCKGTNQSTASKEVAYTRVDSSIPAMLPSHHNAVYYSEKRVNQSIPKTKSSSLGSLQTQKVYDMHENTEKYMEVIISDSAETSTTSLPSKSGEKKSENIVNVTNPVKARSPPKIATPITEVKVEKKLSKPQLQIYSTSTATSTTYQGAQATDSWSGLNSTTSAQSIGSCSSKSRSRKTKSCRDLAWARRVISQHSLQANTISGTELDVNSFTTPLSQR